MRVVLVAANPKIPTRQERERCANLRNVGLHPFHGRALIQHAVQAIGPIAGAVGKAGRAKEAKHTQAVVEGNNDCILVQHSAKVAVVQRQARAAMEPAVVATTTTTTSHSV